MQNSTNELPLVAIAMPTFNSAWALPRVLDSILAYDYDMRRLRLVFVDNYSSDDTLKVLEDFDAKYGKEFESVVIESARANIPVARNICFEKAEGTDYVFILDSDVIAPPDTIKVLLHDFEMYENVAMASFPWDHNNAKERAKYLYDAFQTTNTEVYAYKVGNGCNIVSMEAYHAIGGFNPRLNVHEDGEFCFRLRRHGYNIVCDFTHEGIHLKRVPTPPRFYLKFVWSSSNTYIELLKLGSGMHILKVLSSILLIASFGLLIAYHDLSPLCFFIASVAFAFWVNTSKRVLDDGIFVKPRYILLVGPVLTVLTVMVVVSLISRVVYRGVSSGLGLHSRDVKEVKESDYLVRATFSK